MTSFDYFSDDVTWDIREQILRYHAAALMSDTERAHFFKLPRGCRMREGAKILGPEKLKMGEYCWIGENAVLDASGGLEIGSHTSIGLSVFVWTHDSHQLNLKGRNSSEFSNEIIRKPTKIGSYCAITGPSVIMPGVTIGDRCVVAPLSRVAKDLPDDTIFSPELELRQRDRAIRELEKRIARLEQSDEARLGSADSSEGS